MTAFQLIVEGLTCTPLQPSVKCDSSKVRKCNLQKYRVRKFRNLHFVLNLLSYRLLSHATPNFRIFFDFRELHYVTFALSHFTSFSFLVPSCCEMRKKFVKDPGVMRLAVSVGEYCQKLTVSTDPLGEHY